LVRYQLGLLALLEELVTDPQLPPLALVPAGLLHDQHCGDFVAQCEQVDGQAGVQQGRIAGLERDGVGASTQAKAYRLLFRILGTAVEGGYLARNPCRIRGAAAEPAPEMRFTTVAEVAALADAIRPRFRALVLVAAYTGLRWGELAGLRVKRVDLLHRRIIVAEQLLEVRGRLAFGPTKTGAGLRTVTLPTVAAEALAEHLGVSNAGERLCGPPFPPGRVRPSGLKVCVLRLDQEALAAGCATFEILTTSDGP
jgi:integrase